MKITQGGEKFIPITIVLESKGEAVSLEQAIRLFGEQYLLTSSNEQLQQYLADLGYKA